MTRIDTDLYHLLCVMASIGTVAVGVMLIMLADEAWWWLRHKLYTYTKPPP